MKPFTCIANYTLIDSRNVIRGEFWRRADADKRAKALRAAGDFIWTLDSKGRMIDLKID